MEKKLYDEMVCSLDHLQEETELLGRSIFIFGHCAASLELAGLLESRGLRAAAILDNNREKQGISYKNIPVIYPEQIFEYNADNAIVLITSRFYAAMHKQLRDLGYKGSICKLIDYNSYAEYSLSARAAAKMTERERQGEKTLARLNEKYPGYFKTFCPFNALGDVYYALSYWEAFAVTRNIEKVVFCVPARALSEVIHLFGDYPVEVYEQKELDAMLQAALYIQAPDIYIAHQDRPYVVNLGKALYIKKIPLEQIYCCGVYGLPRDTVPARPCFNQRIYKDIDSIPKGRAVIFSPYAKSVTALEPAIWKEAVSYYSGAGYKCYTNVAGEEMPLEGTEPISPSIAELKSVVERAGVFIGIRSGLCDVIREAGAKKIALYPDYNYSDTKWKSIDMYWLSQFDYNILAAEKINWEKL